MSRVVSNVPVHHWADDQIVALRRWMLGRKDLNAVHAACEALPE